ncbi:MAG: cytochrome c [Candidatus Korobacteraceae bacterium]|jgi:mono/diheme cytochrome c family protein
MQDKLFLPALGLCLVLGLGCQMERRKSDAELGLTPEQVRGRAVYDQNCIRCHEPYSRWGTHGPSLKNLYKKPYLPSGMPLNDERLEDVILLGKAKMPSFGKTLDQRQLHELLAYLKTL